MTTVVHALKVLSQYGDIRSHGSKYWVEHAGHEVSFHAQGAHAICIRVRPVSDHDDPASDYSAGVYVKNIAQAVRLAGWSERSPHIS